MLKSGLAGILTIAFMMLASGCASSQAPCDTVRPTTNDLFRVTTIAPFPRGLAMVDGELYVLCRGRVRGAGGVSAEVNDQAGTIYVVDPKVAEPVTQSELGDDVRSNGRIFALPTDPPFVLWDRNANPPESDRLTDRPYCTFRYHAPTSSFYICAFSGIDQPKKPGAVSFSKNLTDALMRYDLRTKRWHEVERHNISAGGSYPHHDVTVKNPPHGWLNGPDNCLPVGRWLYAVAKDNDCLVRYDLKPLESDPNAGPPPSERVLGPDITIRGEGRQQFYGHSALATHDGWLYVACRTSSVIFRFPIDDEGNPKQPIVGEVVAKFEPYDPKTGKSANITDMDFDSNGNLYVVSAKPSRIYRFKPDPRHVYDGETSEPWADLAKMTDNPKMKSENLLVDGNQLFVTSGDGYAYQQGAFGTVYKIAIPN
ncbi:MAG: hypothetical protein KDA54_03800 [Phycisphaerales bacterium]|nr:hypothetical protein [Phycisphaerales bacterium]